MGMAGTAQPHFSNKNIKFFFSSIHFDFLKQLFWWFQRCFHDISMGNGSVCVMRPPRHRVHCLAVINSHNPCVDTPGKLLLIIFSFEDFLLSFTSCCKMDILVDFRTNIIPMLNIRRCGFMAIIGRYGALLGYPLWRRSQAPWLLRSLGLACIIIMILNFFDGFSLQYVHWYAWLFVVINIFMVR